MITLLYKISQRFTFNMFHGEKGATIEFADFKDRDNIGMAQLGRRLGLTLEPGATVGILTEMGGKELERDFAIELSVFGQVYLAHPAGTDLLDNPVVRDHRAAGQRHIGSSIVVVRLHELIPSASSVR